MYLLYSIFAKSKCLSLERQYCNSVFLDSISSFRVYLVFSNGTSEGVYDKQAILNALTTASLFI